MKRLASNIIVAAISNILMIFTSVVAQYFILNSFGSEINGLTSSVNQFLSYFTLLEAGIGAASIQALYKPLVNSDKNQRDSILSATAHQYRKSGFIFFILLAILSLLMPVFTNSSLKSITVITITFLMGTGNVLNYLFIGRYKVLLSADKRIYILNTLDATLGILFSIIRIILINTGFDIITVQAVALLSPIIRMLFLRCYVKKKYPDINTKATPDYNAISKSKNVLVHRIVGMVTQHTDVTILTVSSTLSTVSVYSVYNLIYSHIVILLTSMFETAPQASFGHLLESKNPNFNKYYRVYEVFFTCFILALLSTTLVLTLPFVSLYTISTTDIDYIDQLTAILFTITTILNIIRLPSIIMINATGAFKETQRGAIIEAILNIGVSIPAYIFFGMRGLLFGTVVALAFRSVDVIYYNYKHIIKRPITEYLGIAVLGIILMILYCGFFMWYKPITVSGWSDWLIKAIICTATALALFFGVFCLVFRKQTAEAFNIVKKIKNKKLNKKGA